MFIVKQTAQRGWQVKMLCFTILKFVICTENGWFNCRDNFRVLIMPRKKTYQIFDNMYIQVSEISYIFCGYITLSLILIELFTWIRTSTCQMRCSCTQLWGCGRWDWCSEGTESMLRWRNFTREHIYVYSVLVMHAKGNSLCMQSREFITFRVFFALRKW